MHHAGPRHTHDAPAARGTTDPSRLLAIGAVVETVRLLVADVGNQPHAWSALNCSTIR